ncbi:MAG: hypothetical protein ACYCWW_15040 [Deltaproteobacteria bacterium]
MARQQLQVNRLLAHLGIDSDKKLGRIAVGQIDRHLVHAARGLGRQSMGAVLSDSIELALRQSTTESGI